jgi:hypothetical protein
MKSLNLFLAFGLIVGLTGCSALGTAEPEAAAVRSAVEILCGNLSDYKQTFLKSESSPLMGDSYTYAVSASGMAGEVVFTIDTYGKKWLDLTTGANSAQIQVAWGCYSGMLDVPGD